MSNLISDEGLEKLIEELYSGAEGDIKEVDNLLSKYYSKLQERDQDIVSEQALTIYGEHINRLLTNKYSARDQLFKVANLIKDRIKKKAETNNLDDILNITELKKILDDN